MNIELISLPKIEDYRGNIAVIEKDVIPFEIKRVYYLFDVPSTAKRGGHAHKEQFELLIPLSGSFEVQLKDGNEEKTVAMNKPDKGLLIKSNVWRELDNFSSGAVCLVISSGVYDETDYIRDFDAFITYKNKL
ncbi:WxcM-like domain-containing protein [Flavobacterium limnosediminis JC2902]|uniref:WxcM-like domain-containing protein n=1 Tax=Flavobacterium limnosediminis JC2902 TaxID=1341181 RepID=V6SN53_9FLAO|nr:FdtA/QdtA family cupin domain-containing protein [Flavobacterium limnosediminis]ESU25840.1 WxcM-like domain-containing protein [Flavobacterium limnosediminis JC2902]